MVNRLLVGGRLLAEPFPWLAGQPVTVTLGLVYGYIPYMVLALFAGLTGIDQRLLEAARDLGASRRRTFVLVTLPLSRQAILAGLVVTALPMFGDYFTNDLLSGSPRTSMVGNLVNDAIASPWPGRPGRRLVLVMMALAVPMVLYIRATARAWKRGGECAALADRPVAQAAAAGGAGLRLPGLVDLPVAIAVVLVQRRPLPLQLAGLAALVLAGPGAVGLERPRPAAGPAPQPAPGRAHHPGRRAPRGRLRHRPGPLAGRLAAGFNFQLLSFVLPEIILAVALLFLFTNLLKAVQLGTWAQLLGLVTFQLSYPVIICRACLLSIGSEYEEAAMDLGASPGQGAPPRPAAAAVPGHLRQRRARLRRRVDDFVLVRYLSADAASEPMSVKIYNSARASPTPALNALATIMLVSSLLAIALGFLVYRRLTVASARVHRGGVRAQV